MGFNSGFKGLNDEREGEQIRKVKNIQYGICDKTTKHCIIERNYSRRSFCGSNRCYTRTCPFSRQMDFAHNSWWLDPLLKKIKRKYEGKFLKSMLFIWVDYWKKCSLVGKETTNFSSFYSLFIQ